jgi:chemotaxis protein MotA
VKATTAIGIGLAFATLFLATIMDGGNPAAFINIPAFLIVVGGTFGATLASADMVVVKNGVKLAQRAIKGLELDFRRAAGQLVTLSEKARRQGLLALESDVEELDDEFARKGLQLVIDGTESDLVIAILQSEMDSMESRHARGAKLFQNAAGFAPTLGILGTVMSLVHVLENLASPAGLGKSIAGAFLATLYGVGSANLLFLPVANRLKDMSVQEMAYREMLLEGILSIQAGDNPRMLAEKLETYVPPAQRGQEAEVTELSTAASAGAPEPVPAAEAA